jgi:hypothetical protein
MFPQQPQQQFRTAGADVQIFYGGGGVAVANQIAWNKPSGVSHIYMMLIGGGGSGDGTTGGASGAVTVWYGAAQHVPDSLVVVPSLGNDSVSTTVSARFSNSAASPAALLTAASGIQNGGAVAMVANQFAASGFFKSTSGQTGSSSGQTASATTFLGSGGNGNMTGNYGYTAANGENGYFTMQPIIVGVGGSGSQRGAIGCGSGIDNNKATPGMVLIASW